jgi:glycosyltransferase involved in cell wall biosynthesis/4-amino-4-deoxy-L-arabinose transferase-like glycosyltransferase
MQRETANEPDDNTERIAHVPSLWMRLTGWWERLFLIVERRERLSVLGIFLFALVVRLLFVIVTGLSDAPTYDGIGYDFIAVNLLQGKGYARDSAGTLPSAFRPPGYPLFLAGVYGLFGHRYEAVRLMQALIDAVTCILFYFVGKKLFGRRVGFVAALGLSLYPLQIYMVSQFYSETLSFFFQMLVLWLATLLPERRCVGIPLMMGLLLGATTLTRPTATLWIPLMLLWVFYVNLKAKEVMRVALMVLGLVLAFGPWTVRNYLVFHAFIPISSLGGSGVWAGNNPLSEGGGMLPDERTWGGEDYPEHSWYGWEGLTEMQSSQRFLEKGMTWIEENPGDFLMLVPRKLLRLWSPTSFGVQFRRQASPLLTAVVLPPYLLFLAMAGGGMVLTRRKWCELFPLYALIIGINALVALTYGATRYGISMAPCLILFATVTVVLIVEARGGRSNWPVSLESNQKSTLTVDWRQMISFAVSVVVPVYNSEGTLVELVRRLQTVLSTLASTFEIILVNDGSHDRSWQVIGDLVAEYPSVRGINLMRNYGQHSALLAGVRAANYDLVITLDDDLQNPPEEIPKLVKKLAEGYDVVYGTPAREQHGLWRDLASQVTKFALQASMGAETARQVSAFRVFRTRLRNAFADYRSPFLSIDVLLTWGTSRFSFVTVRHDPRIVGVSNYTFGKLATHALNMITGFSTLPLRMASMIGFGFTLFGLGVLTYVVGRFLLQGTSVPGFPFLASVIAIFSGAQLFALGIIGEYLARMHFRMMERPTYTVREELENREE